MKKSLRMTEGSISQKIIFFAIPLFLGNLFQQLYNTADSLIVGNFLGSNALAAVSSSGNLIFLMVGFINGIAMGAGVVMYNIFVGVLQSVGDGRHPLIYLIISSCVNVVLDIFFIAGLGMGVGSAALATAISQFIEKSR